MDLPLPTGWAGKCPLPDPPLSYVCLPACPFTCLFLDTGLAQPPLSSSVLGAWEGEEGSKYLC